MPELKPRLWEAKIIRALAVTRAKAQGMRGNRVMLEVAIRYKIATGERSMNINRLTNDRSGDWAGTDLDDMAGWQDFLAGFDLAEDGTAEIDFYVNSLRPTEGRGELLTNVQAVFDATGMVRVEEDGTLLWQRDEVPA